MPRTLLEVFQNRHDEFMEAYSFHEQDEAIRTLAVTGELLDLMFGGIEAQLAMTALREIIARGGMPGWDWSQLSETDIDRDWRRAWDELDGWSNTSRPAFFDELHDLSAFAHFGILPVWSFAGLEVLERPEQARNLRERLRATKDVSAWVESVCIKIDQLEHLSPRTENKPSPLNEILGTRDLARARVKFDARLSITVRDLALLSGVTIKRVQNAIYAKTDEAPVVDKNGLITPEACEPWLAARDYRPSIWKQVTALYPLTEDWGDTVKFEESGPDGIVEDFVFVPVANDGSMFIPALRRAGRSHDGHYTIGAKGTERSLDDYDAALEQLGKMEAPRWRRPNPESGNWGIVSGQTWKRVRRAELEGLSL